MACQCGCTSETSSAPERTLRPDESALQSDCGCGCGDIGEREAERGELELAKQAAEPALVELDASAA